MSVADAYASMLVSAERQALAIAAEEWDAFDQLIAQRCALVDEAGRCIPDVAATEIERVVSQIQEVMKADARMIALIEAKLRDLMEEASRLRRMRLLAAAYESAAEDPRESAFCDQLT